VRFFKIAAGVILILTGIFCFANPGAIFLSIAFLLGAAMLLSGISGVLAYLRISREREISSSLLIEGLMSTVLGILTLSNQLLADAVIPVFFGMWVMFTGLIRIAEAYVCRNAGITQLIWLLTPGVLGFAAGLYAFFNTVLLDLSPILLVGLLFVIQGFSVMTVGVNLTFHWKHRTKEKESCGQ
jgi:uncharacterized membrane protein HdeD (DUF308 family)